MKSFLALCFAVEMLCHQVVTVVLQLTRGLTHSVGTGVFLFVKNLVSGLITSDAQHLEYFHDDIICTSNIIVRLCCMIVFISIYQHIVTPLGTTLYCKHMLINI